jgi:hypothetical protein
MNAPDLGITIRNALVDAIYRLQDDPGVDLLELERFCVEAARRDPAVILAAALELPEVKALVDNLEGWLNIAHHCDITDGCCCCGEDMTNHSEPMSCGHSPVDHGSYVADGMVKSTVAALAALKPDAKG